MITLHFHLQPRYKYELFHINFTIKFSIEYSTDCYWCLGNPTEQFKTSMKYGQQKLENLFSKPDCLLWHLLQKYNSAPTWKFSNLNLLGIKES